jgi:hypothetical protein
VFHPVPLAHSLKYLSLLAHRRFSRDRFRLFFSFCVKMAIRRKLSVSTLKMNMYAAKGRASPWICLSAGIARSSTPQTRLVIDYDEYLLKSWKQRKYQNKLLT